MFTGVRLANDFDTNINIADIVTRISVGDIERYVLRKYQGRGFLDTYETQQRIASDAKLLENYFRNQGYEIYEVHYAESTELINLRKENKKLRHEVSVLAKKLNKMKGD